jgi:methyl coenzyme M reductase gamma subunit
MIDVTVPEKTVTRLKDPHTTGIRIDQGHTPEMRVDLDQLTGARAETTTLAEEGVTTVEEVTNVLNDQIAAEIERAVTTGAIVEAENADQTETLDRTDLEHTTPATLSVTETATRIEEAGKEAEPLTIDHPKGTKEVTRNLIMKDTKDTTVKRLTIQTTRRIEDKKEK